MESLDDLVIYQSSNQSSRQKEIESQIKTEVVCQTASIEIRSHLSVPHSTYSRENSISTANDGQHLKIDEDNISEETADDTIIL